MPTSGSARVGGLIPYERRIDNSRQIGVVFGQRTQLWWDLPVRESLALIRDIYGIGAKEYAETIERFDDVLNIGELMPVMARKLSLGQRMRADLTAALLHKPRIVYLDEPTIGLDIAVKDKVREFVRSLVDDGVTVMLTTHDLGDIEDICQRIVIIDEGRIIYDGGLDTVKDTYARDRTIRFSTREPAALDLIAARLPAVTVSPGESEREFGVHFDRFALAAGEVLTAVLGMVEVVDIEIDEPAIEEVIRKVYAGELDLVRRRVGMTRAVALQLSYKPRLRAYRALAATALKSLLAYRFQFFMGMLGSSFLLLTMRYLWRTILANGAHHPGVGTHAGCRADLPVGDIQPHSADQRLGVLGHRADLRDGVLR